MAMPGLAEIRALTSPQVQTHLALEKTQSFTVYDTIKKFRIARIL